MSPEHDAPPDALDSEKVSAQPSADALARELRAFMGQFRRRLWEHSDTADLTPSQISALLRLEEQQSATTSELARLEGIRPQSMGAIVAALEEAGMIEGAPDPSDGRKTLLSLSAKCRDWLNEGRARRQDWLLSSIAAHLDAEEQAQLLAAMPLLQRLVRN